MGRVYEMKLSQSGVVFVFTTLGTVVVILVALGYNPLGALAIAALAGLMLLGWLCCSIGFSTIGRSIALRAIRETTNPRSSYR